MGDEAVAGTSEPGPEFVTPRTEGDYFTANPTQWATILNAVQSDRFTN